MVFDLQDVRNGKPHTPSNTLATLIVNLQVSQEDFSALDELSATRRKIIFLRASPPTTCVMARPRATDRFPLNLEWERRR
jgi:hypothetical protein